MAVAPNDLDRTNTQMLLFNKAKPGSDHRRGEVFSSYRSYALTMHQLAGMNTPLTMNESRAHLNDVLWIRYADNDHLKV